MGAPVTRKKKAEEPQLNSAIYAKSESMAGPVLSGEAEEAAREELGHIINLMKGEPVGSDALSTLVREAATKTGHPNRDFLDGYESTEFIWNPGPELSKKLRAAQKAQEALQEWERSHIHLMEEDTGNFKLINTSIEGAQALDPVFMLLREMEGATGYPGEHFMEGRRMQEAIPIPNPKEDEKNFLRRLTELEKSQAALPPGERSSIKIRVDKEMGVAFLADTYYLPEPIKRKKRELVPLFRKIMDSGKADAMLAAMGCWNALRETSDKGVNMALNAKYYHEVGERDFAELSDHLVSIHKSLAREAHKRLKLLAAGAHPNSAQVQASVDASSALMKKQDAAYSRIDKLQASRLSKHMSGEASIKKIEEGIKKGYYTSLEKEAYNGIKLDLEDALATMRSVSTAGLEKILAEGMDTLPKKEKIAFERVENLVAHLEFLAWKADMHSLKREMQKSSVEYGSASTGPPQIMGYVKRSKLPMNQLDMRNVAKVEEISDRAKQSIDLMKRVIDSFPSKKPRLLSLKEKNQYKKRLDGLKEEFETGVLSSLESVAEKSDRVMNSVASLVGERALEAEASDESNPFTLRAKDYVKVYALRYSLEVIGGAALVGGVAGGVLGRSPGSVWLGVKGGAKVGSMVVAAAGLGIMGLGAYSYRAGDQGKEQFMDDLRLGSTYAAFGLFGASAKAFGVPLRLVAGGTVAASNSVLLYEDLKAGYYSQNEEELWGHASNAAADLAYIAMGSVAFIRTANGLFRAVRLKNAVEGVEIASASGAAKLPLRTRIADRIAKVHKAGYSPGMALINATFAGAVHYADIREALESGHYQEAAGIFGRGFAEFTRDMVAFDFAIAGVAGSAKTGVRVFRGAVSRANAKLVPFLQMTGLYEKVSAFASEGGLNMYRAQNNARLLELAFMNEGKVSAEYVQAYLGMKSLESARKIAVAIRHDWGMARAALSKTRGASRRAWKWAKRAMKTRAGRLGVGVAMASVIAYGASSELKGQSRLADLESVMTSYEFEFVASTFKGKKPDAGVSSFSESDFYDAVGTCNEISDDIDEGIHPGSPLLKFGGDAEKRKWVLYACAHALLISGQKATRNRISALALSMQDTLTSNGISLTYRPQKSWEGRTAYSTHFGTVVMMAATLLREGKQGFSDAYSFASSSMGKKPPRAFLDYAITSIYASSVLEKGYEWGAEAAAYIYEETRNTSNHNKLGWELFFAFGPLPSSTPAPDEVADAFSSARSNLNFWGQQ